MAWERRERGGRYYTRSRRVNGRVVREYIGGGLAGELAATADAIARQEQQEKTRAWQQHRARLEAVSDITEQFFDAAERVARAALVLGGYHQHHRGEWRRLRE